MVTYYETSEELLELPFYPESPECYPATCINSHLMTVPHCLQQGHNTVQQTWPSNDNIAITLKTFKKSNVAA